MGSFLAANSHVYSVPIFFEVTKFLRSFPEYSHFDLAVRFTRFCWELEPTVMLETNVAGRQ